MWDELPEDVKKELEDPDFPTRQHYARATYALGCRGPLCRKSERDRGLRRNAQRAAEEGKEYKPVKRVQSKDDDLLDKIIAWHIATRREKKAS
jgi:hypothetical protein